MSDFTQPSTCKCYVAQEPRGKLLPSTIPRRALGPNDVAISIKYAGICHSDIHQVNEDWGQAIFPMVPGHEIGGIVAAVGASVTKFSVGDTVGVGCLVDRYVSPFLFLQSWKLTVFVSAASRANPAHPVRSSSATKEACLLTTENTSFLTLRRQKETPRTEATLSPFWLARDSFAQSRRIWT